jgi:hypothetical protein
MKIKETKRFECSAVLNWCEIELTNYCWLDCIWCIRKECNDFWFLKIDILKKIVNFIKHNWYSEIVLSGLWDVFLHKELYEFIDYIFQEIPNIKIYIMTKWQSLKYEDIDKLADYKVKNFNIGITFSIFSLNKDLYKLVTWWWDLDLLLNLIKYSNKKLINFSFEFLIDKKNINNIDTYRKFAELFWKEFMYSIPHNWGWLLNRNLYNKIFDKKLLANYIEERKESDICEAFVWKYLFFDYNWNIFKCWFKRINKELFLGNIWNNFDLKEIEEKKYFKICKNCSFFNYKTNI